MRPADERLADLPMTPVACRRCHATVRVRKASPEQTSIQWDAAAVRACHERPSAPADGAWGAGHPSCAALRASIGDAVRSGALPLADGSAAGAGRGPAGATAEERAVAQ